MKVAESSAAAAPDAATTHGDSVLQSHGPKLVMGTAASPTSAAQSGKMDAYKYFSLLYSEPRALAYWLEGVCV